MCLDPGTTSRAVKLERRARRVAWEIISRSFRLGDCQRPAELHATRSPRTMAAGLTRWREQRDRRGYIGKACRGAWAPSREVEHTRAVQQQAVSRLSASTYKVNAMLKGCLNLDQEGTSQFSFSRIAETGDPPLANDHGFSLTRPGEF